MALIIDALVEILNKPTIGDVVSELALFAAPLWIAVFVGLVVGWTWRPRWASDLVAGKIGSPNNDGVIPSRLDCFEPCASSTCEKLDDAAAAVMSAVTTKDLGHLCRLVEVTDGGPAWQQMMDKSTPGFSYRAWKRDPETGPPQYRSSTIFEDAAPETVRDFFWDDEFRTKNKWDDMLLEHTIHEECGKTGTLVVRWVRKFPFFCSDREYIIGRRIWDADGTYYCVTKGVPRPSVPRQSKPRRVDLYYSSWCIRAVESRRGDGQKTACEVLLFHYEDMGIPWEIAKLGIKQGMWGCVRKIEPGLRAYQLARSRGDPPSKYASMARINTKVRSDYLRSLEANSKESSEEIVEAEKQKPWGNSNSPRPNPNTKSKSKSKRKMKKKAPPLPPPPPKALTSSWEQFKSLLSCKNTTTPSQVHAPSPIVAKKSPAKYAKLTSTCGSSICAIRDVVHAATRVTDNGSSSDSGSHVNDSTPLSARSAVASSRGGMQLMKLSGCYECHAVDVHSASRRYPRPRTLCPCPECGEVFTKTDSLELHQAIRHAVSELGPDDSGRNIVEIIFKSSWQKKDNPICTVDRILKVHNAQRTIARFEDYRDAVKARAQAHLLPSQHRSKNPRCAADGNELLRFHCTSLSCSLGSNGSTSLCLATASPGHPCSVCTVIRHGFPRAHQSSTAAADPQGVRTTASSGRAHDRGPGPEVDGGPAGRRAMLVCRVIAGRVRRCGDLDVEGSGPFDSVAGDGSVEELFVANPRAILPCFVVIYRALD